MITLAWDVRPVFSNRIPVVKIDGLAAFDQKSGYATRFFIG